MGLVPIGLQDPLEIGTISFADWADAPQISWRPLDLTMEHLGAQKSFYVEPHSRRYLVYRCEHPTRNLLYGSRCSTTEDISKPGSWSPPQGFYSNKPDEVPGRLDS